MILHLCNQTATIRRKATTTNANGSLAGPWNTAYSGVACSVQVKQTREAQKGGAERGEVEFEGYFPVGTDIRHDDRVVPDGALHSGKVFTALGVGVDDSGRGAYVRVPLKLVEGGGVL